MQLGFYFDQSRCSGCFTCVVACKDWHNILAGQVSYIRVVTMEKGQFPNVSVTFLLNLCYQCAEPICVPACPVEAITKRKENGIVVVDAEACLGAASCGAACRVACPYDAPQFQTEPDAKMQKCDLCLERWVEGKKPICVEACPTRALDAGPLNELESEYGQTKEVEGFTLSQISDPSIVFKAKVASS